jgi:succinate dehydrogenase / fumarate reductase membrane anchor subunit
MLYAATSARAKSSNFELWSWLFMRISGVALLLLVLIHLAIMHLFQPISNVTFDFVAGRWSIPAWRWYDLGLLWLALIHGMNGARIVSDDYIHGRVARLVTMTTLYVVGFVFLLVGSQVILSFQPTSTP